MDVLSALSKRAAELVPLSLYRRIRSVDVTGFCYHMVADDLCPHVGPILPYKTVAEFERDLQYLVRHFTPVSYAQIVAYRREGAPLPANAAVVTFDDGFTECESIVRPLLLKYDIPCIFFVIGSCVDNRSLMFRNKVALLLDHLGSLEDVERRDKLRVLKGPVGGDAVTWPAFEAWLGRCEAVDGAKLDRICALLGLDIPSYLDNRRPYLTSEQILRLQRDGFTIGAHTMTHPRLYRLDPSSIVREIVDSCTMVQRLTGTPEVPFAFPFNGQRIDRGLVADLRAADPRIGLVFDTGGVAPDPWWVVNRISVDRPGNGRTGRSNLPELIHRAYQIHAGRVLRRLLRVRR